MERFNPIQNNQIYPIVEKGRNIPPARIISVKENPNIKKREYTTKAGPLVIDLDINEELLYSKTENIPQPVWINKKFIGNLQFTFKGSLTAAYDPSRDIYLLGPGAVKGFQKDPQVFYYFIIHESAHREYLGLSLKDQEALRNLILEHHELGELFKKFVTALYTDKFVPPKRKQTAGKRYLEKHKITNSNIDVDIVEDKKGLMGVKDTHSAEIEIDGKKEEVLLGSVITEFISCLASCEMGKNAFEEVAKFYKEQRGGEDPRYDIAKLAYDCIQNDPKLKTSFDKFGLFKNNNPRFLKVFSEHEKELEEQIICVKAEYGG